MEHFEGCKAHVHVNHGDNGMIWCRLAMSCNLAQLQQVVVRMVQTEGMVEEEVVAVAAMVEAVHGFGLTEAVVATFIDGSSIFSERV